MKYLVLLGMLALAAILTTSAHAQSAVTRYATPAIAPDSWMIEAWTGDNRPYHQSRTETDKVTQAKQTLMVCWVACICDPLIKITKETAPTVTKPLPLIRSI